MGSREGLLICVFKIEQHVSMLKDVILTNENASPCREGETIGGTPLAQVRYVSSLGTQFSYQPAHRKRVPTSSKISLCQQSVVYETLN